MGYKMFATTNQSHRPVRRLGDVLLPLAFVEPTERPGHLPGLFEDVLDQGSLMIVPDIQVEDAPIQVHHANKLLAAGSPRPDPFHRLAPYDGIPLVRSG
jgi:hypothetical protein